MTTFQKVTKYAAFTFAICLAVFIITVIAETAIGIISSITGADGKETTKTYTYDSIRSLDVEMGAGTLIIRAEGDSFIVKATNLLGFSEDEANGTLKIKSGSTNFFSGGSDSSLEIIVPKDFTLDKLDVELGAGECTVKNISAKNSEFDNGAGELTCSGFYSEKCKVDSGVGEVSMSFTGSTDDYSVILDKGLGGASVNGESYSKDRHKNSSAPNTIDVDCGIGDIEINFEK